MDTWVQVNKLNDGDFVNAETLNTPIDQLASRTEYLKRRLGTIMDNGVQSSLILNDVDLAHDEADLMEVGSIVYLTEEDGFRLAQAKMHLYDNFLADATAFTIGILVEKTDKKGDVLIYGKLDIGGNPIITASGMLQSGETFSAGRYYLSAIEPGKITSKPSGPIIYIGSFHSSKTTNGEFASDAIACINPQFMDIGTSHVHRAYPLVARPAGHLSDDGKTVIGYLPDNHEASGKQYPSLVFGGTWTQKDGDDVTYKFTLDNSPAWGSVKLRWQKDNASSWSSVDIPAPGVFVGIDNGLKVKVAFPAATSIVAFENNSLSDAERTWTLKFPDAGKGWVNHEVTAIADAVNVSYSDQNAPRMKIRVTGALGPGSKEIYFAIPRNYSLKEYTSNAGLGTIQVDGVLYQAVSDGESVPDGTVPVKKAATIFETLKNLADAVNEERDEAVLLLQKVNDDKVRVYAINVAALIADGNTMQDYSVSSFNVIGGKISRLFVYDSSFEMLSPTIYSTDTYSEIDIVGGKILVYAENATSAANCTCYPGTLLKAYVYDPAPDAIYEYAMGLHQSIDYYFPPVPAQSAGLFVNGVEMENAALFPDNPTYMIGRKTIYWMEDDAEHLPWPAGIIGHDDQVLPADDKTIAFYFTVGFQCSTGPVTSIVPSPNSPLKIYTYGTKETAYTGDLEIDAAFDFKVNDANVKGYNVAKQGAGGALLAGPVVEKIRAGNGLIVKQDPGCPEGQGTLTISLDNGTVRDQFSEIALENAKQEKIGLFPYISLLGWRSGYNNIPSAFTMMMRVPTSIDQNKNYKLHLRMTMFGTVGYSSQLKRVAGLQLEYNILPDYTGDTHNSLKTGLVAPSSPRQINLPLGHNDGGSMFIYEAFDPFVATTENDTSAPKIDDVCVAFSDLPIPSNEEISGAVLKPGYLVAIRISRVAPTNIGGNTGNTEYTDPLGFLSMEWSLEDE